MLKFLSIENIAIIKRTDIEFSQGFNVLTGETGAGKSILIDAINAALGERTYKELIRSGCDNASVTAVFCDADKYRNELAEMGISIAEDNCIYLQRILSAQGRNVCRINGVPVPVSTLKEIGEMLINIHGQHDNRNLLDPANHLSYLDKYAASQDLISDYYTSYNELRAAKRELKVIVDGINETRRLLDLYNFQKNEIESASVRIGEREELVTKREVAKNSKKICEKLSDALEILSGGDGDGVIDSLSVAANSLSSVKAYTDALKDADSRLLSFGYELSEIEKDIKKTLSDIDFSELELENINERITVIDDLFRKYGNSEEQVLGYYDKICDELEKLAGSEESIKALEDKIELLEQAVYNKGRKLTEHRMRYAEKFSKELCEALGYLQMPNVVFKVDFAQSKYTATGCDAVEFLLSANPGQAPKPLAKIASGGELSRIMLAFKSVFSHIDDVATMIFDEIDTGISGTAAEKVGTKLLEISKGKQVICVTHLAQIAAKADTHFLIEKNVYEESTETKVNSIERDARIKEIARLISGKDMTENLYNTAQEMLKSAK